MDALEEMAKISLFFEAMPKVQFHGAKMVPGKFDGIRLYEGSDGCSIFRIYESDGSITPRHMLYFLKEDRTCVALEFELAVKGNTDATNILEAQG